MWLYELVWLAIKEDKGIDWQQLCNFMHENPKNGVTTGVN